MFSPRHVILLQPAKFCRNQVIRGGVMTSYRFFKMATMEWEGLPLLQYPTKISVPRVRFLSRRTRRTILSTVVFVLLLKWATATCNAAG